MSERKIMDIPVKTISKMINMIPGTLVYKGAKKDEFFIDQVVFSQEDYTNQTYASCNDNFINQVKHVSGDMVQWINITGISNIKEISKIGELFQMNLMLLEQVLNISKHSLYKITDQNIFSNFQMIYLKNNVIINETLSIYFNGNTVLTFQEREGDVFDSIRNRLKNNEGYIRNESSVYTYFCILDALVDHYIDVIEKMKNDIEIMELKLMENQSLDNKELHILRKEILIIRLSATPIEKLVQELLKMDLEKFEEQKNYFDSLSEHLQLAMSEIAILKESVDSLYENYMMTNANDMNHVMTILTIFSAIFIPLSFAAGVFGMNFERIPGLDYPFAFMFFIGGCGLTAFIMLGIFKWKKWF